ncbi:MAG TPA: phage head-tail connector protein [Stenotrophobium sp.]|nr:phage head-tail connector protein [Stenotrophobium sp.]
MALQLITPPTAEPMDLAEAKLHLREVTSDQDTFVAAALSAAREFAENFTRKQLVNARWKQVMDAFPSGVISGVPFARPPNAIYLDRGPVTQVVSIQYLDMEGVEQTADPATYTVDYSSDPVRITPVFGQIWPIPMPQIGAVWVTFDAGYAAPITADKNASTIAVNGLPPFQVGDAVRFSNSGGALPAPLKPLTGYTIASVASPGVYTLKDSTGAAVALTDTGSGTSYLGEVPDGIKAWMKLRMGTLDSSRDEPSVPMTAPGMGFADRLLDGYRTFEF